MVGNCWKGQLDPDQALKSWCPQTHVGTQTPVTAVKQERTYFQYPSLQRRWQEEGFVFAGPCKRAHQLRVRG